LKWSKKDGFQTSCKVTGSFGGF